MHRTRSGWVPDLNPVQQRIFASNAKVILAHSEKGSGKTVALLHKAIRHCYEEPNALAIMVTPAIRTGREGLAFELESLILPQWTEGLGLVNTGFRMDPASKDRVVWIGNMHDGWSKLICMSVPYLESIEARVKAMSPSFVFVDELTEYKTREIFTYIGAQLGRRRGVRGPQPFTAATNPDGPSHWVYKVFFEECVDEETGERDPDFDVIHVPVTDNLSRLPPDYVSHLKKLLAHDPYAYQQLIEGKWVDRPSGEALFKHYFDPGKHVIGNEAGGTGLMPDPKHPIIVGYDIGAVNHGIVFLQAIPVASGIAWLAFDEIFFYREKITLKTISERLTRTMKLWNETMKKEMFYEHVTDSSAVEQWRSSTGSFDAWEIERHTGGTIKMRGCPKTNGSVAARMRLIQSKLHAGLLLVSARCRNLRDALLLSNEDPKKPLHPIKRSKHNHMLDALTYPMLSFELIGAPEDLGNDAIRISTLGGYQSDYEAA